MGLKERRSKPFTFDHFFPHLGKRIVMASSYTDDQNENSSVITKKIPKDHVTNHLQGFSSNNSIVFLCIYQTYDLDWIRHTNAKSFLNTDRHPLKKPITDQGLQKRLSKYNGIVNRLSPAQVDEELTKRQLSTRLVL